jgi:hypothetical protein
MQEIRTRLILCLGRLAGEHRQGDHEATCRAGRSDRRGRPDRLDENVDGDAASFVPLVTTVVGNQSVDGGVGICIHDI